MRQLQQRAAGRSRQASLDDLREIAGNIDLVNGLIELEALEMKSHRDEVHL